MAFRMNCDFNVDRLVTRTFAEEKRLVYNTVQAINKTALYIQAKIRADMERVFVLRRSSGKDRKWILDRIKVKFASVKKGDLFAEIYIDQKPRLLLATMELGGLREPVTGKAVAVPVAEEAREGGTIGGAVKPELTFKGLRFHSVDVTPDTRPDAQQFKGEHRTFILKSTAAHPMGGVFERIGPGPDDIRMIYSFKQAFQLKQLMHVVETAKREFAEKFQVELSIAYAGAPPPTPGG